jgi:hypothetical protein
MRFNTFDEVKNWYESTKPVREKQGGTVRDIRPIDGRRYKERRIVKIDDSCYVLSDGWHYGGGVTDPHDHNSGYKPTTEDMIRFAPIVWRRAADGTETIAVRNSGYGSNTTAARHDFLRSYLPKWLTLVTGNRNGKHFIRTHQGAVFFPEATALPVQVYDVLKVKKNRWMRGITRTDKATLLFQREGHTFILLSEPVPEPMKRVAKDVKAPYVKAIREFREWLLIMGPMLTHDWRTCNEARNALNTWIDEVYKGDRELAHRAILRDPTHPQRINLMHVLVYGVIGYSSSGALQSHHLDNMKRNINEHINKACGFITTMPR